MQPNNKKVIYIILLIALIISASLLVSFYVAFRSNTFAHLLIKNKFKIAMHKLADNVNIGILVIDADSGKQVYAKNSDRYFSPASNEKLFTAYAALNYLGPNFTYTTNLYTDIHKVKNGLLQDDIYLKFSGDPTLTDTQLNNLIGTLKNANVQAIQGHIIIDDNAFDNISNSLGTAWDDAIYAYGAPVHAIIINHNSVEATLIPAKLAGEKPQLILPNHPQFMQFINLTTTGDTNNEHCKITVRFNKPNTYIVTGCIKTSDEPKKIAMAIADPRSNAQFMLLNALQQNHIIYNQAIYFGNTSNQALYATQTSAMLPNLIQTMLKDSDNMIADAIYKTLGASYFHEQGTWDNSHQAIHNILLNTAHLDIPMTTLIDGSGGSRYDYVTPEQIISLLNTTYHYPYAKQWISALPIAGIDGTLKKRMTSPDIQGNVFAKTGTETGVSTLSGYLITNNQHTLIFSIMINNFIDLPSRYQALEDELCRLLITYY